MQTENSSVPGEAERLLERAGAAGWWLPALEVLAWVVFFAFAGVFLTLRYWLLPHIGRYRGAIVAELSHSIGLPVKIGSISAEWQGLRPRVHLGDVRLYDDQGRVALVLPSVDNVVSWRSLLHLDLRLYSLVIEAPRLEVRRDAQGALYVAGLKLGGARGEGGFAAWLLAQREVRIRDAEITWTDARRAAPPLRLSAVDLRVRNRGARHALGLAARLPRALGNRIDLRASLTGGAAQPLASWSGEVYAALGETDLAGWRAWVDYPVDLRSGRGALRLWADFAGGRLRSVTADVALAGVAAQLGPDLAPLRLASVHGRLQGAARGAGYELAVRRLALATGEGAPMRSTSFTLRWQPAAGGAPARGALEAERLELAPLAQLAGALPLPARLRALLEQLAPRGELLGARLDWHGALADAASFAGQARFAGLGMNAWHALPGFAGLAGSVSATERGGTLQLDARDATVDLPKIFPQPRIALDALQGELDWQRTAHDGLHLRIARLSLANAHLAGSASGSYDWPGQGRGVIDLSARLSRADGSFTAKYLPLPAIMGPKVRAWLARAVVAGQASDVRLRLKGDLSDFPFADPAQGQFQVSARINDGTLAYADGWPKIEHIDGTLLFARDRLQIDGSSASVLGTKLSGVSVGIASLLAPHNALEVSGRADGATAEFLKFIAQSPLRRMTRGFTRDMRADGRGQLTLKLSLPLDDPARVRVSGEYRLSDDVLHLRPGLPPLERVSGSVRFTQSKLELHALKARLLGEPVTISGGVGADGGFAVTARGHASVAALQAAFPNPWWRHLAGSTAYVAHVTQRRGVTVVTIESPLTGMASTLPPPLAKAAGEALPLRVELLPGPDDASDRIALALGSVLRAELLRVRADGGMAPQRTSVALHPAPGVPLRLPEHPGTLVYGTLPRLDLDRWLPLLRSANTAGGAATLDLKLGRLAAFGKELHAVTLHARVEPGGWSAQVGATELNGELEYRYAGGGKLIARLKHFQIPPDAPGAAAAAGGGIKDLPAVDLSAESFSFRGKPLGRVEIGAQHEGADWRVDRLRMSNPDATLTAHGLWRSAPRGRTSLEFKLEANEAGKFLGRIGYPGYLKGGSATLAGHLSWRGEPLALDYPSLSGALELHAQNGQFLEMNPGVGKLFSLMSLQMLPRRVTLDFRDVFSKGFQFDTIASSLQVKDGIMTTRDFKMSGSAADVDMSGQVDLGRETQDLQVRVVPSIGDSASTVLGLVNPLAGVTSFIAQHLLKNPLGQIFAYKYAISGSWDDPKVKKLQAVPVLPQTEEPNAF